MEVALSKFEILKKLQRCSDFCKTEHLQKTSNLFEIVRPECFFPVQGVHPFGFLGNFGKNKLKTILVLHHLKHKMKEYNILFYF